MPMSIIEFVESSLSDKSNKQKKFLINTIDAVDALIIETEININIENHKRIIDNFGVKHTFKKHGNAQKEASRGQIAIEIDDFACIPTIVSEPDAIVFGEVNEIGNVLIKYIKNIGEIQYVYVEEMRTGRKELALQTFYKRAIKQKIHQPKSTDFDIT